MDERSKRVARRFEWPVIVAALLVIPVIFIEASDVGDPWDTVATIANWLIWIVFAAEVIVMLAVVPNRKLWLRKNPLDVAIVILTPPFLPASLQAARLFRLLRLVRLAVTFRVMRTLFSPEGLQYAALVTLFLVLGGGAAFVAAEKSEQHLTLWQGVYWAITTVTTVGYGDPNPMTDGGRVIASVVMIVGIGFIAMLTAALAQRFITPAVDRVEREVETIDLGEAELLREIREISQRLQRLERALDRPRT
jgi:voltage-gated potassium channel